MILPDTDPQKQKQLEIILSTNPAEDEIHTWIRSVDDIQTFEEMFRCVVYNPCPDFTAADIEKALESGKIVVYSSKPIENGNFVSPSEMEAASYSGDETVYRAEVDVSDIAWIDETQGQVATDKTIEYERISCKGMI